MNDSGANARRRDRSEREVQFARALAEQLRLLRIDATDQFLEQRAGWRVFNLQISLAFQDALVIAADGIERERPHIAFIGDSGLQ